MQFVGHQRREIACAAIVDLPARLGENTNGRVRRAQRNVSVNLRYVVGRINDERLRGGQRQAT